MLRYTENLPSFHAETGYESLIKNLGNLDEYEVLSKGNGSIVRRASHDGELFVVRTPDEENHIDEEDIDFFHNRIAALHCGLGQQCLEQLVSYTLSPLLVVTRHAPGNPISTLTERHVSQIKVGQFSDVLTALDATRYDGIILDTGSEDNALYHPKKGFTLIDYGKDDEWQTNTLKGFLSFIDVCFDASAIYKARKSVSAKALAAIRQHYPGAEVGDPGSLDRLRLQSIGQN